MAAVSQRSNGRMLSGKHKCAWAAYCNPLASRDSGIAGSRMLQVHLSSTCTHAFLLLPRYTWDQVYGISTPMPMSKAFWYMYFNILQDIDEVLLKSLG